MALTMSSDFSVRMTARLDAESVCIFSPLAAASQPESVQIAVGGGQPVSFGSIYHFAANHDHQKPVASDTATGTSIGERYPWSSGGRSISCSATFAPDAEKSADKQEAQQALLKKIKSAAQKLNYFGTFICQQSHQIRMSRITHVLDGRNEIENMEILSKQSRANTFVATKMSPTISQKSKPSSSRSGLRKIPSLPFFLQHDRFD